MLNFKSLCLHNVRDWTLIRSKTPLWPTHIPARAKKRSPNMLWRPSVRSGLWVQAKLWSILHRPPTCPRNGCKLTANCEYHYQCWTLINNYINYPPPPSELDQWVSDSWVLVLGLKNINKMNLSRKGQWLGWRRLNTVSAALRIFWEDVERKYCRMVGLSFYGAVLTKALERLRYKCHVSVSALKTSASHIWCCLLVSTATDFYFNLPLNLHNPSLWINTWNTHNDSKICVCSDADKYFR